MSASVAAIFALKFASSFLRTTEQNQQYRLEAENELQNAEILRLNAHLIRRSGAINEDVARAQNRAYIAEKTAIANEAGIGDSPTLMTALGTTFSALEQNVLNARFEVESEAENYLYQARVKEANAKALKKKANSFENTLLNTVSGMF